MKKKYDYTITFKATKRFFNLFNIRMIHVIHIDAEPLEEGSDMSDSIEEMQDVIEQYAEHENLIDPKLISYTRYA